MLTTIVACG